MLRAAESFHVLVAQGLVFGFAALHASAPFLPVFEGHFISHQYNHLGFAQSDGGAAGLAVAFGWNSTPDLLTRGFGAALAAARARLSWADLLALPVDLLALAAATPDIVAAAKAIPVPMTVGRVIKGVEQLDDLLTAVEGPLAKLGDRLPDVYREPYERADRAVRLRDRPQLHART